ncbi:MAG TPA: ATP-binding protein [Chitinophagales bacterium]|nr:ATP-binding protein [Chitinophagales bacterium]
MAKVYESTSELTFTDSPNEYAQKVEANEMNPVKSVYLSLLNLGTHAVERKNQKKYIRITNFVAIITFLGTLSYLSFAIFWEKWYWLFAMLSLSLTCLGVLALNSFGRTTASRVTFLLGFSSLVLLNTLFVGSNVMGINYLFIALILPFLIFDVKKTGLILMGIMMPLVFIYSFDYLLPYFSEYNLGADQQNIVQKMSVVLQCILLLSSVYQFVFYNRRTEKELENSNGQMMLQTSELRRSNSDLEQFAYIISHDLKAPVRNISSFMNLLVNKYGSTMNPEAREFVDYSHTGAKRLERLIDDVLAYCRIGTNLPKPIPVNLNDVVSTIRFELREKLSAQNAKVNINKELPIVNNVHSSLMYHVFQNLISNGLKFNKKETPEININWTNSLNYYTFSISDNGIGISKEYSTTIFQMFKRLHNESDYDGTGIGLAICKKIVEYYHGEVWFDSTEGEGTTFHFTIRKF